ncbi:MAG TPA: (2Fe-2S)-binding protein [Candidatus Dormibacteraeota bacterium]|jgi:aerobic-type carbon monoxide dehydrogenase small subunit (CoxS/CutS family)|nr:(2Fe-2S)-binding protein [Candidatus Dormibacteraeota bacterium]
MARVISLLVNDTPSKVDADARSSLLSILREQLELTGTKYGCGEGQCGACTVLIDGVAHRSCLTPAADAEGKAITTIEGLAKNGRLHPLQEAFLAEEAMQCAYCASGMIMSAVGLLQTDANPTESKIKDSLEGNVCRCGTHPRIVAAVQRAARIMKGGTS